MEFTDEQVHRYSRQIILPDVGGKGQKKLLESKVLVIGAGGLGSPAALYLAAAGIGKDLQGGDVRARHRIDRRQHRGQPAITYRARHEPG